MLSRRLAAMLAGFALAPLGATAQTFTDAPVSCGSMTQFKGCTAAFDGHTLRVTYTPPEGKPSYAIYKYCTATAQIIHCPEGRWHSDAGAMTIGARSLGLRDSVPYKD